MHLFKCMLLIKALDFNSGNGDILVNYEDIIVLCWLCSLDQAP